MHRELALHQHTYYNLCNPALQIQPICRVQTVYNHIYPLTLQGLTEFTI